MHQFYNKPRLGLKRCPPMRFPVVVRGLRWRTPPDHVQELDEYGAPVPPHVAFVLRLQLADDDNKEGRIIVVRWSQVEALHAALAPTWPRPWAPGYTKDIASKITRGKVFTLRWGSCLDPAVAEKRLSVVAAYLEMVLQEPKLRTNAHVKQFLTEGQARAEAWGLVNRSKSPLAASTGDTRGLACTAATMTMTTTPEGTMARTTTTTSGRTCSTTITTSTTAMQPPFSTRAVTVQAKDTRITDCVDAFSRKNDVRAWLTMGGPVLAALGIPPARVREVENNSAKVLQLLLLDGRLLASFFETRDINRISRCRKGWRSVVGQISALRPRSAHQWGSRWQNLLQHRLTAACDRLQDPHGNDFSQRSLKAHAARRDREQAGWDRILKALEQRLTPHLQSVDMYVDFEDRFISPRLRDESQMRLFSSLSHMPHLLHLDLTGLAIDCRGALALAETLQHTPNLKYLSLSGNPLGGPGMIAIANAFPKVPKLEYLGLIRVCMGKAGIVGLAANLKHLPLLKNFGFDVFRPRNLPLIIARLATDLPNLQFLTLCGVFDPDDAVLLGEQIGLLANLEYLTLHFAGFQRHDIRKLMVAAHRGLGMPAHLRVYDFLEYFVEDWREALPAYGRPRETIVRRGKKTGDQKDPTTCVLDFLFPGAKVSHVQDKWISKEHWLSDS